MVIETRHHYVVERFYPDAGSVAGVRMESDRIDAYDDAKAVGEAAALGAKAPIFFQVKKVTTLGDIAVYDSRRGWLTLPLP